MKVTILKIEMPKGFDWGLLQINNFNHTHFRFELKDGKPVLDATFFVDNKEPYLKNHVMEKDGDFYLSIQKLLEEYVAGLNLMDVKKEMAFVTEKRVKLDNQIERLTLMEHAIQQMDRELLNKLKRDFEHVQGQIDYVEKRIN